MPANPCQADPDSNEYPPSHADPNEGNSNNRSISTYADPDRNSNRHADHNSLDAIRHHRPDRANPDDKNYQDDTTAHAEPIPAPTIPTVDPLGMGFANHAHSPNRRDARTNAVTKLSEPTAAPRSKATAAAQGSGGAC